MRMNEILNNLSFECKDGLNNIYDIINKLIQLDLESLDNEYVNFIIYICYIYTKHYSYLSVEEFISSIKDNIIDTINNG